MVQDGVQKSLRDEPMGVSKTEGRETNEWNHSSLDDLQNWPQSRTWQGTSSNNASQIPLSPSTVSSIESPKLSQRGPVLPGHSLEQLTLQPHEIPLPESATSRKRRKPSTTAQPALKEPRIIKIGSKPIPSPETIAYRNYINSHADGSSDLHNTTAMETRRAWGSRIVFYDYTAAPQSHPPERQEPWKIHASPPLYNEFYNKMREIPAGVTQRVILVEDLTPHLVDLLGATFQIPPQVFEEHLHQSGYANMPEPRNITDSWKTRYYSQGYSSITWYRPVLPLLPISRKFRAKLVTDRSLKVHCVFAGCVGHKMNLRSEPNIWRNYLELCPDPGVHFKNSQTEYPVGWEEKATIWTQTFENCEYVILFLDPLPYIVDGVIRRDSHTKTSIRVKRDERNTWHSTHGAHEIPKLINARNRIPQSLLSTMLEEQEEAQSQQSSSRPSSSAILQSSSSVQIAPTLSPRPISPEVPEASSTAIPRSAQFLSSPPRHGADSESLEGGRPLATGTEVPSLKSRIPSHNLRRSDMGERMEQVSFSNREDDSIRQRNDFGSHGRFVPYQPIKTRSSSSASYNDTSITLQMRGYNKDEQRTLSTLDEFDSYLKITLKNKNTKRDTFGALLRIVHDDTLGLVDIIRVSLQQIREGTLNEDLMQRRVTFWRNLLYRLHFSLGEVDERLQKFIDLAYGFEVQPISFITTHNELQSEKLAKATRERLQGCMSSIDRSSDSLRAEMQIVDSRRSIAEAESISKLTELAFVFIPLSFVASIFSMQVKELEGGVPLYQFVLVAIVFVAIAYAVRLGMRSARLLDYKTSTLNQMREEANLGSNEPIPTHTFLVWFGNSTGRAMYRGAKNVFTVLVPSVLILAAVAAVISPIALLWLRKIDKGFTCVITILLLLLDSILVYPVVTNTAGDFDPKALIRTIQQNLEKKRKAKEKEKKRLREEAGVDLEWLYAWDVATSSSSDDNNNDSSSSIEA